MIYRKHGTFPVRVKTCLEETVAAVVQNVVHINFIRRLFSAVNNLHVAFIRTWRGTARVRFHHKFIEFQSKRCCIDFWTEAQHNVHSVQSDLFKRIWISFFNRKVYYHFGLRASNFYFQIICHVFVFIAVTFISN